MKTHSKNIRRSVRLGIPLTQPHMAAYLTGAVGTAAMLGAPQAEAAVTAVTFGFGSEYTLADGTNTWAVGPGFGTLYGFRPGDGSQFRLGFGFYDQYSGQVYHNGGTDRGLTHFFANGTVIGPANQHGYPGAASFLHTTNGTLDLTADQLNKNIGFRTSSNHWGWANVSWTESSKTLAINGAFVESAAGNSITINESLLAPAPEPSRALLALAGLGGVALRRRRKQAA